MVQCQSPQRSECKIDTDLETFITRIETDIPASNKLL
jgi:hypothetical protein